MTGIPVNMLQNIQKKQTSDNVKLQMVTSDNGTLSFIDANTGKIVSQTQPGIGGTKTTGTGSATTQDFNDTASNLEGYNADNGTWIGQFPQLVQQFAPYMTLTQIYNKYISSPLG